MSEEKRTIMDTTANPAPLGLVAFGMTTVLLNLHNSGLYELSSMILGMGIFYGGIAQVIAGIMEWKKGNTFGTVAFTSYGLFWLSLVALLVMPALNMTSKSSESAMIAYFIVWGIFTLMMFFGTLKANRALQFIFASLALLFFLLAIRDITGNATIATIAGVEGVICGASAVYTAMALVLNEVFGRVILPIGPVAK
jgi:succinate-acetate transporter protein